MLPGCTPVPLCWSSYEFIVLLVCLLHLSSCVCVRVCVCVLVRWLGGFVIECFMSGYVSPHTTPTQGGPSSAAALSIRTQQRCTTRLTQPLPWGEGTLKCRSTLLQYACSRAAQLMSPNFNEEPSSATALPLDMHTAPLQTSPHPAIPRGVGPSKCHCTLS